MDPLTNIPQAALAAVEADAREQLVGTAYPHLADALTAKVCELVRGMPGEHTSATIAAAERLVALQLLTGRRSGVSS